MLRLRCTGRLATDTVHIRGAVGDALGLLVQNLVTIIAAYVRPCCVVCACCVCFVALDTSSADPSNCWRPATLSFQQSASIHVYCPTLRLNALASRCFSDQTLFTA